MIFWEFLPERHLKIMQFHIENELAQTLRSKLVVGGANRTEQVDRTFKTRPCNNMQQRGMCSRGNKCTFAHSVEELNLRNCFDGRFCRNMRCRFYHPDLESKLEYFARTRQEVPVFAEPVKFDKKSLKFTKPCEMIMKKGRCYREDCTFAHTLNDLVLKECNKGKSCGNLHCQYFHPNMESKVNYYKRIGKEAPLEWCERNIDVFQAEDLEPEPEFIKHLRALESGEEVELSVSHSSTGEEDSDCEDINIITEKSGFVLECTATEVQQRVADVVTQGCTDFRVVIKEAEPKIESEDEPARKIMCDGCKEWFVESDVTGCGGDVENIGAVDLSLCDNCITW